MLDVGDKLPNFTLPVAHADGKRDPVQLSSLLGHGPIVLSFFPLAFTRVCTTQMCDMRDRAHALDGLDAQRFGFSCDTPWANAKFAAQEHMPHGIFSDPNRDVVDQIWASEDVAGIRRVPKRGWMVVSSDGTVAAQWVAAKPGDPWPGNAPIEEALAALRKA